MSYTEMLHLNLRSISLLKSLFKIDLNQMTSWWKIVVPRDTADSFVKS